LPCPFCGSAVFINSFEPYTGAYAEFALPDWKIRCQNCRIEMRENGSHWESGKGTLDDETQAKTALLKRWNARGSNTKVSGPAQPGSL
jgi:hypothetical protein